MLRGRGGRGVGGWGPIQKCQKVARRQRNKYKPKTEFQSDTREGRRIVLYKYQSVDDLTSVFKCMQPKFFLNVLSFPKILNVKEKSSSKATRSVTKLNVLPRKCPRRGSCLLVRANHENTAWNDVKWGFWVLIRLSDYFGKRLNSMSVAFICMGIRLSSAQTNCFFTKGQTFWQLREG